MNKRELIDAIIRFNPTAAPKFLSDFRESDLRAYLERICAVMTGEHTFQPKPTDAHLQSASLMAC